MSDGYGLLKQARWLEQVVAYCIQRAGLVVALAVGLALVAGFLSAHLFRLNSDTSSLISPNIDWRQREIAYDKAFPGTDGMILAVIDGETPELADDAAARLGSTLIADRNHIRRISDIQGGAFLRRNGLLFLPVPEVEKTTRQLIAAQPFLGPLAGDPSLRGLMDALGAALGGVARGQAKLSDLHAPMSALTATFSGIEAGQHRWLSWQSLIAGGKTDPARNRRLIQIYGVPHYGDLSPGAATSAFIRTTAKALELDPAHGVRVRLTGPGPLADEEFASLADRAGLMVTLMAVFILASLWLALRSWRIIGAIVLTLFCGLAITTALGLLMLGTLNVISVAFIPLFTGIGVDFGIQFSVRYRAERHALGDLDAALVRAGGTIGASLSLAAAATASAFFSFLPTKYSGIAQLGQVAGTGMIVAFALSVTLLPALVKLVRPSGEAGEIGLDALAPVDLILQRHRKAVLGGFAALAVLALLLLPALRFDFNPMDLRSQRMESVAAFLDLFRNPDTSPNTIDVLAPSLGDARSLASRLSKLPEVDHVLTIESFVPEQQKEKLALISDASLLLDTTLSPLDVKPAPSDAETVDSLHATAVALRGAAKGGSADDALALRFAAVLDRLSAGSPALRRAASDAVIPGLKTLLAQLRDMLAAEPVSLATIPADFKRDWLVPDGRVRVNVVPRGDANDNAVLQRFTRAVTAIAPDATGEPIGIQRSGHTIVLAFIEAGLLSFVVLVVLLGFVLRSVRDVALAIAPLLLAGLLTLGTCVAIGLQLNFANIIALPLLFGLGVSFDIYFVVAARQGERAFLRSSLARAVIFSAMTTATGFGALWVSSHPGTASMGELLMISLAWTLVSVLFLLPALVGE